MQDSLIKCIRVSDEQKCRECFSTVCVKNGRTRTGKQQYRRKDCGLRFIAYYSYTAYSAGIDSYITQFIKEGLGIRSIARILKISTTTLLRRIRRIAAKLRPPYILKGKQYEVDEIKTFVGNKKRKIWIAYALERESRRVVSFKIGNRNNGTLKTVLQTLFLSEAKTIYTDKLPAYTFLIPDAIHRSWPRAHRNVQ